MAVAVAPTRAPNIRLIEEAGACVGLALPYTHVRFLFTPTEGGANAWFEVIFLCRLKSQKAC